MIKIQDIVKEIVLADEEFLSALTSGYANLSAYAKRIQSRVEKDAKKKVGIPGIVVALSRERKSMSKKHRYSKTYTYATPQPDLPFLSWCTKRTPHCFQR